MSRINNFTSLTLTVSPESSDPSFTEVSSEVEQAEIQSAPESANVEAKLSQLRNVNRFVRKSLNKAFDNELNEPPSPLSNNLSSEANSPTNLNRLSDSAQIVFGEADENQAAARMPRPARILLNGQPPAMPALVSLTILLGEFDSQRLPFKLTGPQNVSNYNFHSGRAAALKYQVEVGGKKIPVYLPKNPEPGQNYQTIEEVAKGIAALPETSLKRVNSVSVDPKRNPDDSYWMKKYNDPNHKSYMTAGADGNISIYPTGKSPQEVVDSSLIHETGHIISKQLFGENSSGKGGFSRPLSGNIGWGDWNNAMKKDSGCPSGYAQKATAEGLLDEDFAETYLLYIKVIGTPEESGTRATMPERFAILDKIIGN